MIEREELRERMKLLDERIKILDDRVRQLQETIMELHEMNHDYLKGCLDVIQSSLNVPA